MAPQHVRQAQGNAQLAKLHTWLDPIHRQSTESVPGVDPVFICLDTEKWERSGAANPKITEIGISILDTRKLQGLSIANNAAAWQSKIVTRHLRIHNYSGKEFVNKMWLTGCPDNFDFGSSEFVLLYQVPGILRGICMDAAREGNGLRPMVFVGHAVHHDTKDLATLGWAPSDISNPIGTIDTQLLALQYKLREKIEYLTGSLINFIPPHFHNAGNDAHYTMINMVLMGVRDAMLSMAADPPVPQEVPLTRAAVAVPPESSLKAPGSVVWAPLPTITPARPSESSISTLVPAMALKDTDCAVCGKHKCPHRICSM